MISFFNNSDKFIITGSSEVSLYELREKSHEPDFGELDTPTLQNLSK